MLWMLLALTAFSHAVLLARQLYSLPPLWRALALGAAGLCFFAVTLAAHLFPPPVDRSGGLRMQVLMGGRRLVYYGLWASLLQLPIAFAYRFFDIGWRVALADWIFCAVYLFLLLANGMLRILCTGKRLNIVKRLLVFCALWVPGLNIVLMLYSCRLAWQEYDHECYKVARRDARVDTDCCKTKYPLVMVHGVGFRDLKYLNYWGRIPRELLRNGATVYYGNQEAWGTIEANAADLKETVLRALEETGSEKVNLVAHSKGGLDARYMISMLGMAPYVASLTTISTPHRGSPVIDRVIQMPGWLYRAATKLVNGYFRRLGDKNPDFYEVSHQFTTGFCNRFNETVRDAPEVYYQSYMSVMRDASSDPILCVPYLIVYPMVGENDGLVAVDSAKWGEFRGVFRNTYRRGISHGDMIDLHRDDYRGFDVVEAFVRIVSDLKERGY